MNKNTESNLTKHLQRWKEDRGALAALRCALRPALQSRAWSLLAQLISLDSSLRLIYETVVGLWAYDPDSHRAKAGNFGSVCRTLRGEHETFDVRFRQLLSCDSREELCARIVPICLAAQRKGISIDYDHLFRDLKYYRGDGIEIVRIDWAQSYWAPDLETPKTPNL
jgi:CRISPR system Cascade subunit CasB